MASLRHADDVIEGYELDLEDLKAKLHAKHDRVASLETALRDIIGFVRTGGPLTIADRQELIGICLAALAGGVTEPDTL